MTEVKVNFYLKRNEEKADGTVPILGRIRIGKSMVQFSAKVSVSVSLWDTKSGRATGKRRKTYLSEMLRMRFRASHLNKTPLSNTMKPIMSIS
jgi:hypothetical protein